MYHTTVLGADPGDDDPAGLHGLQGLSVHCLRIPEPSVQVNLVLYNSKTTICLGKIVSLGLTGKSTLLPFLNCRIMTA